MELGRVLKLYLRIMANTRNAMRCRYNLRWLCVEEDWKES